jgi:hypothetical protein
MKYSLLFVFFLTHTALNAVAPPTEKLDKNEHWVCTLWSWSGQAPNREVWCRRWEKQFKPYILRS